MILYFLKSASCLALLLIFYHLILEKEKMHSFNRFYLLIGVLASFLIPLATITSVTYDEQITINPKENIENPILNNAVVINETSSTSSLTPVSKVATTSKNLEPIAKSINYNIVFLYSYFTFSILLFFRFGINLFKIIRKTKVNHRISYKNAILILVDDEILPHTFWKYIFINKKEYFNEKIEQELFTHELTHVTQKHTLDVLLIEFLQIIFWINPTLIFLKKAIQLNHEFLADEKVINQHKNTLNYQHLLLNKAAWNNEYYLTSNLNYALTKKRLKMMTMQSSPTKILLKKLTIIPLLVGFLFLFAQRVEGQKTQKITQQNFDEEVLDAFKEYGYRNTYIYTKDEEEKTIKVPYSLLSDDKKKKLHPVVPLKLKKKAITNEILNNLKKEKTNRHIFIDGFLVNKEALQKYKASDFSYYSSEYKNYNEKINSYMLHCTLETNQFFEQNNKQREKDFFKYLENKKKINFDESSLKKIMNNYSKNYSLQRYSYFYNKYNSLLNKEPHFTKKSKEERDVINDYYYRLKKQYSKLSIENQNKVKKAIKPYHPYNKLIKDDKVFYKLDKELIEENITKAVVTPKKSKLDSSNLADFTIKIEKKRSSFMLKCTKGCDWKELTFNLNKNESIAVDQFGAGNRTDYSSDFKILVKNIEDELTDHTFTVESLKGTNWLNRSKLNTKNKAEINQYKY
ncbi:M56 family metallopeptidase [Polaribacter litorisediminis]|uniref:M56 family metallopeptidase n=1 Tax=Polaribacter litorisediminis TaxID=1908341 RepID=UPI001CBCB46D|nr:M56 family metallopeptidase [Polaribacter litorisediminis]UAM96876.1 M56 family metallopeptidase [Polaribacter litorisediminis]